MLAHHKIRYCAVCGAATHYVVPDGDNRERAVCTNAECAHVHYENPLNVVGTVPFWQDTVLLCKRNIEPRFGFWTLPAGFMELDEGLAAGALRETVEEAGINVRMGALFAMMNVVRVGQVHFFYLAEMLDAELNPGPETSEARFFREDEIPWDALAFRTVRLTLEHYFEDRRKGQFGQHSADIT
jgi:ADP-ribose pyrophosphatase YjhB (NUDIX family)